MRTRELAETLRTGLVGDPEVEILGVAPLGKASPTDLSFLNNPKYRPQALASAAGAVLVSEGERLEGRTVLPCPNPYAALARALRLFHPEGAPVAGVHPTAVLGEGCHVAATASIGPYVVLGEGTCVGERTTLGAGTVVGRSCSIGNDCRIYPRVVMYDGTVVGDRVNLHAGCVLGSDGFGYAQEGGIHLKVPQVGRVVVEDDVEIGANTTVDRGALEETRIGRGSKIDNLVQVAHNVAVGPGCILLAQSGISGSTVLGAGVVIAGQSGAVGHIHIGDGAKVGAKSAVTKDVPSGGFVTGHPARDHRLWLKERALVGKLDQLEARLKNAESHLRSEMGREKNHD
jgi:UDP-3-O-[3-hydroxymyristoyl] glucosamine N-acyltransferase